MPEEIRVLKEAARLMDEAGVPYMVSGSIAMNFYAQPRMTRDIDIVIVLQRGEEEKFVSLLENDFYVDRNVVMEEAGRCGMFNVIHNRSIVKIDFIMRKEGEYDVAAFDRRRPIEIGGDRIWLISPEDLVLAKLKWARESLSEMQIKDVRSILASVDDLDMEYVVRWIGDLKLSEIFERARI